MYLSRTLCIVVKSDKSFLQSTVGQSQRLGGESHSSSPIKYDEMKQFSDCDKFGKAYNLIPKGRYFPVVLKCFPATI